ncbi:MAG TPA: hypothetical protein VJT72_15560 [Pseudonocardiaceae bacterium]|nr:hypothetical protein [Pseudonocardiaceae bacterium]
MDTVRSIDPYVLATVVTAGAAVVRLIILVVALRGTTPRERPAIIRALADFFHVLPRRHR